MTHVWPSDDDFADGATAYGNWPGAYMKANLWSTATTIAHPTSGNYTHGFVTSDLYDIYSSDSLRCATAASNPGSWLWRSIETASDVVATLSFGARVLTGSAHNPDRAIPTAFVFARVSGGTYVSGTNALVNPDRGYAFGWITDASLESSWYLLRLDAGPVVTVVASGVFRGAGSFFHNTVTPYSGGSIQLSVSTVAGNVHLVGKLIQQRTGTITTTIFNVTDSSVNKITAAGRIGFGMSGLQNATGTPGGYIAPYATSFQIDVGGTLTVRDEWTRSYQTGSLAGSATVGGILYSGNSLLQGWVGDYHSPTAFASRIYRSQVAGLEDRINFDPAAAPVGSGTGVGGFLVSQRPPTDPRSMNRSTVVRFSTKKQDDSGGATNSTPFRAAGIFARVSGTGTPSTSWQPTQGYLAIMYRDDAGPTTQIQLYRWNGTPVLIAQKTAFTINADTNYTLRFDVYNQADASGAFVGAVSLRVFVGGVQVVLVDNGVAGVTASAAGTVIDGSSSRVIEGPMEGLYCFLPNGSKTIYLDTWAESTLTNSLVTVGSDQASIAMLSETDDYASDSFDISHDWGFEDLSAYETNESDMESGHHVALLRYSSARPAFRISIAALSDDDRDTLLALWDAVRGCEIPFDFTHPVSGTTIKAHFVDDKLGDKLRDVGVHSFEFEIEGLND